MPQKKISDMWLPTRRRSPCVSTVSVPEACAIPIRPIVEGSHTHKCSEHVLLFIEGQSNFFCVDVLLKQCQISNQVVKSLAIDAHYYAECERGILGRCWVPFTFFDGSKMQYRIEEFLISNRMLCEGVVSCSVAADIGILALDRTTSTVFQRSGTRHQTRSSAESQSLVQNWFAKVRHPIPLPVLQQILQHTTLYDRSHSLDQMRWLSVYCGAMKILKGQVISNDSFYIAVSNAIFDEPSAAQSIRKASVLWAIDNSELLQEFFVDSEQFDRNHLIQAVDPGNRPAQFMIASTAAAFGICIKTLIMADHSTTIRNGTPFNHQVYNSEAASEIECAVIKSGYYVLICHKWSHGLGALVKRRAREIFRITEERWDSVVQATQLSVNRSHRRRLTQSSLSSFLSFNSSKKQ